MKRCLFFLTAALAAAPALHGDEPVAVPRPVPATRPEMKRLLEEMKQRPLRIPLPELTDEDREALGDRADSYEARLRHHYLPPGEASPFGGGNRQGGANRAPRDFTRNADENMSLSYPFKTMLFWIVSRTNNCQYCLGHQEQKLSAAGLSEDQIAAIDFDWSRFTPAEQAAFAYARKLTYAPYDLGDEDIAALRPFYSDMQILEMTMSVAGNNAINRWKEGAGIPQSSSGINFFRRTSETAAPDAALPIESFETPTAAEFTASISRVAAIELDSNGLPTGRALTARPPLESRQDVEAGLEKATHRQPRLPLASVEATQTALEEPEGHEHPAAWLRLLANFPRDAAGRIRSIRAIDDDRGDLTPLQKAQVSWIVARQDRAWYALGMVRNRLRELGQTDDQIFALDDADSGSETDQAMFTFARHLAAAPVQLTDEDVAAALQQTSPRVVVQLVNFVTSRAYFDRVTEAAGLPVAP